MNIKVIIRIDELIRRGATGTPEQLAARLNMSERSLYNYIRFMREELKAPIEYSKPASSYRYVKTGNFQFTWMRL